MGGLGSAVEQGKALYVGISSCSATRTREAASILGERKVPCLINQPSYNMFNRWIEKELLDVLGEEGIGCIAFTPLAQGLLTDKYLARVPEEARINRPGGDTLASSDLSTKNLTRVRGLNQISRERGQSLVQMGLAWVLRDPRVTSTLIGASRPEQIHENVAALRHPDFTADELAANDRYAREGGVSRWARPSHDQRL